MQDPEFAQSIQTSSHSLLDEVFPASAKRSVVIFLSAIGLVALGAVEALRPSFPTEDGELKALSMNLAIQMVMLAAGAAILILCEVDNKKIASTPVFKAGMTAVFSVFGVAWMADTFFEHHVEALEASLGGVVESAPWALTLRSSSASTALPMAISSCLPIPQIWRVLGLTVRAPRASASL